MGATGSPAAALYLTCQYLTSWCKWIDSTINSATTAVRRHKVMSLQFSSPILARPRRGGGG